MTIRIEPASTGQTNYFVVTCGIRNLGVVFHTPKSNLGKFNAVLRIDIGNISVEVTAHAETPAEAVKKARDLGYYGAGSIDEAFNELKDEKVAE
jgi:hypothetical protein